MQQIKISFILQENILPTLDLFPHCSMLYWMSWRLLEVATVELPAATHQFKYEQLLLHWSVPYRCVCQSIDPGKSADPDQSVDPGQSVDPCKSVDPDQNVDPGKV